MASGFFGVTGPAHFELGLEAGAHQRVERVVLDLHQLGYSAIEVAHIRIIV
jgi:hypothetical protein